jgi:anti-anti-sigma factor
MVIDKKHHEENGKHIIFFGLEGLIKLGESAHFLFSALHRLPIQETVVFDLSKIDYIDSTGIGELVGGLANQVSDGRRLRLIGPPERVLKLFKILRMRPVVFESRFEAIATLCGDAPAN